jgi:hypothetical protein
MPLCPDVLGWASMRLFFAFLLASVLCALPLALGSDEAAALAQPVRPSSIAYQPIVKEVVFQCGMFDGSFSCRAAPGGEMHGKNANPGASAAPDEAPNTSGTPQETAIPPAGGYAAPNAGAQVPSAGQKAKPGEHACPPGYTVLAVPGKYGYCQPAAGTAAAASEGCQHGMVGAPPNCHCPKNSELLGGNCVHYTATMCQSELPVNVNPEPCQDVEAKLSCKMRQDGLKDCCCVTYDKL